MAGRRVPLSTRVQQDQRPAAPAGRGAGAFLPDDGPPRRPLPIAGNTESASQDPAGETWDANHKRVTFYCPLDLLSDLEEAVRITGRSKTQFLVEGLRLALDRDGGKR